MARLSRSALRPDDDSRLARLVREGVARPARRSAAKACFATKPPRLKKVRRRRALWRSGGTGDEVLDASAIVPLLVTETLQKRCSHCRERFHHMTCGGQPRSNARRRLRLDREASLMTGGDQRPPPIEAAGADVAEVDPKRSVREAAVRFLRVSRFAPRMRCSSPPPFMPRTSTSSPRSSRSTTGWPRRHEEDVDRSSVCR